MNQFINRCIDAPDPLRFAVFHGLGNNTFKCLDISDARELVGYASEDDFVAENPQTRDLHLDEASRRESETHDIKKSGIRNEL